MALLNKQLLTVALLVAASCALASPFRQLSLVNSELDPYPALGKPRLLFKPDGTFKVTIFSDLHFGENPWDDWGPKQDANSLKLMNTILPDEKPDYVVLNGDLITGENTFKENATTLIDQIVGPLNAAGVPFSSTHGNHDNQRNITHYEEILREQQVAPLSYTRLAPKGVGGESGPGNYWVPVYKSASESTPALILWFFDSRGGFAAVKDTNSTETTPVPDWVDESVTSWITEETARMEAEWGPSEGRGALAFMHIPPHEIQAVQGSVDSDKNPDLNADTLGSGSVQSTSDQPFWDTLTTKIKNLHAIISGHDHGNEWCARENAKNVIFCFNKHSGYGGYGKAGWGYGVRNIIFSSPDPKVAPQTWIRLEAGETRAHVTLNDEYGR
ncbi:Metallo-dependent phosphatase-like protein [Ephemerocybe angulata]|uniref:Metallo-dependent phosphatase-like protein n=1 Tax=Ephemerocybe angulata TaxID=980116 RepID=A0A8H6M7Y5_9AGAR|nr:Metallo-dependent phosphatase-like protein [Tulosesus angulatus]